MENERARNLEHIKSLRYMDDEFMSVCLADNFEGVELILRIVLGRDDITVKSVRTQEPLKNLQGRSAILDVHATDSDNKEYDIEIQRADAGTDAKRARHNSSLLDAHILKQGDDTSKLPDSYVIFITENDVMKENEPIYPVERYVTIGGKKGLFGDGSHILYVNGSYRGDDAVGRLMYDFSCTDPNDMNYEALAKRARYFKQEEKGGRAMTRLVEEITKEVGMEKARLMFQSGKISLDEMPIFFPELSKEEIQEIEAETVQLA